MISKFDKVTGDVTLDRPAWRCVRAWWGALDELPGLCQAQIDDLAEDCNAMAEHAYRVGIEHGGEGKISRVRFIGGIVGGTAGGLLAGLVWGLLQP